MSTECNMAYIYIKKRNDPIHMDNVRARKIKDMWLGTPTTQKANPNDLIDLGTWSGEFSRIASIEMEVERKYTFNESDEQIISVEQRRELFRKFRPDFMKERDVMVNKKEEEYIPDYISKESKL